MKWSLIKLTVVLPLGLTVTSCAIATGEDSEYSDEEYAATESRSEPLTGAVWDWYPERVGVVRVRSTWENGSGIVWRSWRQSVNGKLIVGSYVLTARHVVSQYDEQNPSQLTVRMGGQSAVGVYARRHPTLDLAIIRVNKTLVVNGLTNWKQPVFTGDYGQLNVPTGLICYGYGAPASPDRMRYAYLQSRAYSSNIHDLALASYGDPNYKATIERGDSGGPCLNYQNQLVATIYKGIPSGYGGGGSAVPMDGVLRQWIANNSL